MTTKTPANFGNHDEWLAYVRSEIPVAEQPYALAFGRTELFRSFYRMQQPAVPNRVRRRIETHRNAARSRTDSGLRTPERHDLQEPDEASVQPGAAEQLQGAAAVAIFSAARVGELLGHLAQNNRYFALWAAYKKGVSHNSVAEEWDDYLRQELGAESAEEIAFAQAMAELDKLLNVFLDGNRDLPSLVFERIWFLHYLRGPERMAQTRAVLGMLTAELAPCTSA